MSRELPFIFDYQAQIEYFLPTGLYTNKGKQYVNAFGNFIKDCAMKGVTLEGKLDELDYGEFINVGMTGDEYRDFGYYFKFFEGDSLDASEELKRELDMHFVRPLIRFKPAVKQDDNEIWFHGYFTFAEFDNYDRIEWRRNYFPKPFAELKYNDMVHEHMRRYDGSKYLGYNTDFKYWSNNDSPSWESSLVHQSHLSESYVCLAKKFVEKYVHFMKKGFSDVKALFVIQQLIKMYELDISYFDEDVQKVLKTPALTDKEKTSVIGAPLDPFSVIQSNQWKEDLDKALNHENVVLQTTLYNLDQEYNGSTVRADKNGIWRKYELGKLEKIKHAITEMNDNGKSLPPEKFKETFGMSYTAAIKALREEKKRLKAEYDENVKTVKDAYHSRILALKKDYNEKMKTLQ